MFTLISKDFESSAADNASWCEAVSVRSSDSRNHWILASHPDQCRPGGSKYSCWARLTVQAYAIASISHSAWALLSFPTTVFQSYRCLRPQLFLSPYKLPRKIQNPPHILLALGNIMSASMSQKLGVLASTYQRFTAFTSYKLVLLPKHMQCGYIDNLLIQTIVLRKAGSETGEDDTSLGC